LDAGPNTHHDTETRGRISMRRKVVRRRVTCDNLAEPYRSGRSPDWVKVKSPDAPFAKLEMLTAERP
jgi:hypothetical protein